MSRRIEIVIIVLSILATVAVFGVAMNDLSTEAAAAHDEADHLRAQLAAANDEIARLNDSVAELAPKVETRDVTVGYVPDGSVLLGKFNVSHYDTGACCCNPADGITASGRKAVAGYSVAVDPKVVPLGTLLLIDYGDGVLHEARADDTGKLVKGNKLDLCVGDHETAVQLGVRSATVYAAREASK